MLHRLAYILEMLSDPPRPGLLLQGSGQLLQLQIMGQQLSTRRLQDVCLDGLAFSFDFFSAWGLFRFIVS